MCTEDGMNLSRQAGWGSPDPSLVPSVLCFHPPKMCLESVYRRQVSELRDKPLLPSDAPSE